MLVGHYGPAYALKRWQPQVPLWALFLAVQLVDVAWSVLVLAGVEKLRIVPGITATNALDLYYMPYTHGLLSSLVWAVGGGAIAALLARRWRSVRSGIAVGAAILSHWVLDLIVHRPDLPLYDDTAKVGLGLWDHRWAALGAELGLVLAGLLVYLRGTRAIDRIGRYGPWGFLVVMVGTQVMAFFGRPPETPAQTAITALVVYVAFTAIAAWLDRHRATR